MRKVVVNLSHDRLDVFPERGLYPAQAEKVRGTFFPNTSQVNLRQVRDLTKVDSTFRGFIEALIKHKKDQANINTKTPAMQAVNCINQCLKHSGGGSKIPQPLKDYFITTVGSKVFNQKLIENLSEESENNNFSDMYKLMLARYPSKHVCDMSIRQIIRAHRKKTE